MKKYPFGNRSTEFKELVADDGHYALRSSRLAYKVTGDTSVIEQEIKLDKRELLYLYQAIQEEISGKEVKV